MKSEKKIQDKDLPHLRKRMRIVGILILVNIVFRYFLLYVLANSYPLGVLPIRCYLSIYSIPFFLFGSITILSVFVGIKMIIAKCQNLNKYLIFLIILESLLVLSGFCVSILTQDFRKTFAIIGVGIILPIIGYSIFKRAVKNEEYEKTFVKETKLQKIFFVLLLLTFLGGLITAGRKDWNSLMQYRRCIESKSSHTNIEDGIYGN